MNRLRITTVQTELSWENVQANLYRFYDKLADLKGKTDLIVLPEMFTTGFSMNAQKVAERINGKTINWLSEQAAELDSVITGSIIIEENGEYYNRLIWMRPDGTFSQYNKRHLFTLAGEHHVYSQGETRLLVDLKGWKICPLICYDLRFPVWSRNVHQYDLLLYVANWPMKRSAHWKALLTARAIENQCYTIGVNRCGQDENGLHYSGDTSIIDYSGNIIHQVANREDIYTTTLNLDEQKNFRTRLNFLPDADDFTLNL